MHDRDLPKFLTRALPIIFTRTRALPCLQILELLGRAEGGDGSAAKVSVDAQDEKGYTALYHATMYRRPPNTMMRPGLVCILQACMTDIHLHI